MSVGIFQPDGGFLFVVTSPLSTNADNFGSAFYLIDTIPYIYNFIPFMLANPPVSSLPLSVVHWSKNSVLSEDPLLPWRTCIDMLMHI
jgi:hypothetical protein